ncbi:MULTISPECIES: mitofilin family membrane protein [unclassified Minwuia]|jgi:predicted  nucleic acid-binding Zn-ribbon protein|uniref:COG4223 family protein n=1 Tax=unclassified Minwuia TaxID=2618799 RepID=UPI00247A30CB|nr:MULTISPECIES: mitofilin family membrane protein [unclassified Minwuia]
MTDKDDKKPKPEEAETQETKPTDAAGTPEGDADEAAAASTSENEVVEVVAAGGAVPVTEVDADKAVDADAAQEGDDRAETATGSEADTADVAPPPPPPPAAAQPRKRADGGARFLALVAILLALGVGATTILPQISGGAADRIAALKTEVANLADQNRALAARVADAPAATPAEAVDLSGVEGRLEALEAALAGSATIEDRLAALEAGQGGSATPAAISEADFAALRDEVAALAATVASFRTGSAGSTVSAPVESSGSADTEALASELGDLEQRLTAIEDGAGDAGTAARDLRASLDALRDRMAALASETDALSSRIDAVAEAAASQRGQADAEAAQKAALVLALGRLRDVAATGAAFPGAWNSVVELGVDPAEHAVIADAAQHGVPTADALRQRFPAAADAALTAERIGGDDTWYGAAFQRLGNLVSVRRVGEVEGTGVEAIVTRAEYRLQEGNLEAALAELDGLSGPPAEAVASWRVAAEQRLKLEQAIRALQQDVFQNMSQGN